MVSPLRRALLAIVLAGGCAPPGSVRPPTSEMAPMEIVEVRGDRVEFRLQMQSDGSIIDARRTHVGRIEGDRVRWPGGEVIFAIAPDGRVEGPLRPHRILPDGSLEDVRTESERDRLHWTIDPRGIVDGHDLAAEDVKVQIRGFQAGRERTAWLLFDTYVLVTLVEAMGAHFRAARH
jgi:hypothetical protein